MTISWSNYSVCYFVCNVIKTGGKIIIVVNGSKDITRFIESLNHGKFKEVNHERSDNSKLHYITAIKQ